MSYYRHCNHDGYYEPKIHSTDKKKMPLFMYVTYYYYEKNV